MCLFEIENESMVFFLLSHPRIGALQYSFLVFGLLTFLYFYLFTFLFVMGDTLYTGMNFKPTYALQIQK